MNSMRWGIALSLVAIFQIMALCFPPTAPQRWAAFAGCLAWIAFTISANHGGMPPLVIALSLLVAPGQLFVCGMLWASRWKL